MALYSAQLHYITWSVIIGEISQLHFHFSHQLTTEL